MIDQHSSLTDMTVSAQQALVRGVLDGNDEVIATFRLYIIRLLIEIAGDSPLCRDYGAFTKRDIADKTFAYLVCGQRPTGGIKPANDMESPLHRWLLSAETQCPLSKYVAYISRKFMRDLLRDWQREHKKNRHYYKEIRKRHDKIQRLNVEAESRACKLPLQKICSPVEETVMISQGVRQLTEEEQEILRRLSQASVNTSQTEVARSLGVSNATMTRRVKAIRDKLASCLDRP